MTTYENPITLHFVGSKYPKGNIMNADEAKALRAPFPAETIGKLPKPLRKDAEKGRCDVCGGWHGLPAVHLDYVGHAATTDRLLQVDPAWSWEPFALTPDGLPALDREGNLWIRLTVAGVTRPGVGDGATMKERIGDALRNAAMRFGVALDLWAKEDLHATATDNEQAAPPTAEPEQEPVPVISDAQAEALKDAMNAVEDEGERIRLKSEFAARFGIPSLVPADQGEAAAKWVTDQVRGIGDAQAFLAARDAEPLPPATTHKKTAAKKTAAKRPAKIAPRDRAETEPAAALADGLEQ